MIWVWDLCKLLLILSSNQSTHCGAHSHLISTWLLLLHLLLITACPVREFWPLRRIRCHLQLCIFRLGCVLCNIDMAWRAGAYVVSLSICWGCLLLRKTNVVSLPWPSCRINKLTSIFYFCTRRWCQSVWLRTHLKSFLECLSSLPFEWRVVAITRMLSLRIFEVRLILSIGAAAGLIRCLGHVVLILDLITINLGQFLIIL